MSAFILNYNHINAMLNFAVSKHMRFHWDIGGQTAMYCTDNPDDCQTLGAILVRENVRSILARYQSDKPEDYIDHQCGYRYGYKDNAYSPVQIVKACDCYDYQSCETPDYDTTFAARISEWIRGEAISALPGYDSAQWEIN